MASEMASEVIVEPIKKVIAQKAPPSSVSKTSDAEIKLQNTQVKLEQATVKPALDYTNKKVIFEKKIIIDQAQNAIKSRQKNALIMLDQGDVSGGLEALRQVLLLNETTLKPAYCLLRNYLAKIKKVRRWKCTERGF